MISRRAFVAGLAFAVATKGLAQAVVVLSAPPFSNDSPRLAHVALTNRLPTIAPFKEFAVAGGMMAYGPDEMPTTDVWPR